MDGKKTCILTYMHIKQQADRDRERENVERQGKDGNNYLICHTLDIVVFHYLFNE